MNIIKLRHAWPEKANFEIDRPFGAKEYILLHFWNSMDFYFKGKKILTNPYAFIIFNIDTPQWFHCKDDSIHDWIHIIGNVPEMLEKYNLKLDTIYYPKCNEFITDIIRELEVEFSKKEIYYEDVINIKLNNLFLEISRNLIYQNTFTITNISEKNIALLNSLYQELCKSYFKPWKVSDMSKYVNMSESYFSNIFKTYFGIAPMQFLILVRIDHAKNLLSDPKTTISEIPFLLGYGSITHFIRQFKKFVGVSPSQYRKNNKLVDRSRFAEDKLK